MRGSIAADIEQYHKHENQLLQWTGALLAAAVGIGSTQLSKGSGADNSFAAHEIVAGIFLMPYLFLISSLSRLVAIDEGIVTKATYILDYVERPLRSMDRATADKLCGRIHVGWENYLSIRRGTHVTIVGSGTPDVQIQTLAATELKTPDYFSTPRK